MKKGSRGYYALGFFVFIAGFLLSAALLVKNICGIRYFVSRVVVPGSSEIAITQPGNYAVWYEYGSIVGDKVYASGERLPSGFSCQLIETATGSKIGLIPVSSQSSYSFGSRRGRLLWGLYIERPGDYELRGSYDAGYVGPEIVITLSYGALEFLKGLIRRLALPLMLLAVSFLSAVAIILFALVRQIRGQGVNILPEGPGPDLGQTQKHTSHTSTAMFCHLSALSVWCGLPLGNIILPLVIWSLKRTESEFIDTAGKESLNFQLSMTIYSIFAFLLVFVLIGIPLLVFLSLLNVVLVIAAAIKTSKGESFRYPISMRFVK